MIELDGICFIHGRMLEGRRRKLTIDDCEEHLTSSPGSAQCGVWKGKRRSLERPAREAISTGRSQVS